MVFTAKSEYVPTNGWGDKGDHTVPALEDTKHVLAMVEPFMSSPTTTIVPLLDARSRRIEPVKPIGAVHVETVDASA
jgi:hypothetical protein